MTCRYDSTSTSSSAVIAQAIGNVSVTEATPAVISTSTIASGP